jgi:hypothetical protein
MPVFHHGICPALQLELSRCPPLPANMSDHIVGLLGNPSMTGGSLCINALLLDLSLANGTMDWTQSQPILCGLNVITEKW